MLTAAVARRFQGGEAATDSTGISSSSRRNFRHNMPTWRLPRFEIHDVRDEEVQGSMTRVSVDRKMLLISQFPQLGPRKLDPNDITPQFDSNRRISVRLRHMDLAALVGVVEGVMPSHHMKNNAYDLTFSKTEEGYSLKGLAQRSGSQAMETWSVDFKGPFAVSMKHFLQNSLTESFGFRALHDERHRREVGDNSNDTTTRGRQQRPNSGQSNRYTVQ